MSTDNVKRYRKRPVVIEALQFTRNTTASEVWGFCPDAEYHVIPYEGRWMEIRTLEGTHRADEGDYIIKGIAGEFYPCKPDIFAATYEEVT